MSGFAIVDWYTTTHQLRIPVSNVTITHSSSKPNEAPIDTRKVTYTVPAYQPRLIELPTLHVSGFIQRVGLDQDNAVTTPDSIHMAGWYTGSAKPGENGSSIIDGHVSGRYEPAIFKDLHLMKAGDPIKVEYGNGSSYVFTVVKVGNYSASEAAVHMFDVQPSVEQQLVLITCAGIYSKNTATFDRRVLVYAKKQTDN
jgi:LPXTG-site transpeptidase (sortase) family protein